jgi:hypothetical protein
MGSRADCFRSLAPICASSSVAYTVGRVDKYAMQKIIAQSVGDSVILIFVTSYSTLATFYYILLSIDSDDI